MSDIIESVSRLSVDLAKSARTLGDHEARFLVDAYYMMQDDRKRAASQLKALDKEGEPNAVLEWLAAQSNLLEKQIARALDQYTSAHMMGSWMREVVGIGPILAAGLLAHIDITKAPTAGHIWQFAGIAGDNQRPWLKGEKRPYNAKLKTLCCHPSSMVMTSKGAKRIDEIAIGDEVLTHKGRFQPVTAVHKTIHSGSLVGLRTSGNSGLPLYLTDNHPIYTETRLQWVASKGREHVSFGAADRILRAGCLPDEQVRDIRERRTNGAKLQEIAKLYGCSISAVSQICNEKTRRRPLENERMWVRADGIMPGWLLCSPCLPHGKEKTLEIPPQKGKCKKLPPQITVDSEMARFFGLFTAEGHVSRNYVGFSFHKDEVEYQEFVSDVLTKRFGLSLSYNVCGNSWQGIVSSKALAVLMTSLLGTNSFNKKVPQAVLHGPRDVKSAFMRGWFEGDGDLTTGQLTTSSAWCDAQSLLTSIGVPATITPYQRSYKISTNRYDLDQIVFEGALEHPPTRTILIRQSDNCLWAQARELLRIYYDGPVFNLEVDQDHSYTVNSIAVHNCWKIGQSFMKSSGREGCVYGHIYRERKELETANNAAGQYAAQASRILQEKKIGKTTEAYKHYSEGRLPLGHIDARARRYAVKIFLSHLQAEWYRRHFGEEPPKPFAITILGHAHQV